MPEPVEPQEPSQQAPEQDNQPVTMSALKSMLQDFAKSQDEKIDGISRGRAAAARKTGKTFQNNAPSTDEIDRIQKIRQDGDEQLITRTLRSTFDSLNAVDRDKVANYFRLTYGDRIAIDPEDGLPIFHESADKKVPLGEYLASWVRSADGEMFVRPPKGTGPIASKWAGSVGVGSASASSVRSMDLDELMQLRIEDPMSFYQYTAKYPEEFGDKRAKWERRMARGLPPGK